MRMNPDLKVEAQNNRVGEETQNIYTDQFMESLDGVANALDNGKQIIWKKYRAANFLEVWVIIIIITMIFQLTHVYTWIGVVFTTKNLSSNRERLEQWEIPRCDFLSL